jgi:transposase
MERKVKYGYELKLEIVRLVIENNYSTKHVSRIKGITESIIRRWVNFYKKYGKIGLIPRKNVSYTIAFKLKVLKSLEKNGFSLKEACVEFNIPSESIIIQWRNNFTKFGIEGLNPKPRGRPKDMSKNKRKPRKSTKPLTREEELLKEIERLNCENDLLKKLHALIQAEESKNQKP